MYMFASSFSLHFFNFCICAAPGGHLGAMGAHGPLGGPRGVYLDFFFDLKKEFFLEFDFFLTFIFVHGFSIRLFFCFFWDFLEYAYFIRRWLGTTSLGRGKV